LLGEQLLAPRPTPKLEDHPLSAVRDCLFNIIAATLHTGGRSSIRNLRTPHTVVTGTHYHGIFFLWKKYKADCVQSKKSKKWCHSNSEGRQGIIIIIIISLLLVCHTTQHNNGPCIVLQRRYCYCQHARYCYCQHAWYC
jgi:hypothetical protein